MKSPSGLDSTTEGRIEGQLVYSYLTSLSISDLLTSFKIGALIGQGGQKTVFSAVCPDGNDVALKIGKFRSKASLERLQREVDLLSSLDCEGIGKIRSFHTDLSAREFLIVEPLHIAKSLRQCGLLFNNEKSLRKLLIGCFRALSPVWEKRVVHRDLKPDNILITRNYQPIIIDFGIARFLDHSSLTASAAPHGPGTPLYAPREQLTNRKVAIDQRADFFSLAVMAAELLCQQHPFSPEAVGNDDDVVENIIAGRFNLDRAKGKATPSFLSFIEKNLQAEPYLRFRTENDALQFLLKDQ